MDQKQKILNYNEEFASLLGWLIATSEEYPKQYSVHGRCYFTLTEDGLDYNYKGSVWGWLPNVNLNQLFEVIDAFSEKLGVVQVIIDHPKLFVPGQDQEWQCGLIFESKHDAIIGHGETRINAIYAACVKVLEEYLTDV